MADMTQHQRDMAESRDQAMPGGRYPIRNRADLENAIRAVGRAKGDRDMVRRFIIRRAKALGLTQLIPDTWNADGSLKS